ncbi:MAG: M10 family metallopeptidase C-terminal domain-containing protein [Hyphomicrobiaceae bacterium]
MTQLNAYEQFLLEAINTARLDPKGEAARLGIDLNENLAAGTISASPKDVLAPSNQLWSAARGHSNVLAQHAEVFDNVFDGDGYVHNGVGDGTPTSRIAATGFHDTSSYIRNENVALSWATGTPNILSMLQQQHDGLFIDTWDAGRGHRLAMMDENVRQVGIGVTHGTLAGKTVLATTENFGRSGDTVFVTGVAFNDSDGDGRFDVGEQRSGITATATNLSGAVLGSDTTGSGGGYAIGTTGGSVKVTFTGGGLSSPVAAIAVTNGHNAKIDLVDGHEIHASLSTQLSSGAADLKLLGIANITGWGNSGANVIEGNAGNNTLSGLSGNDTLKGLDGNDWIIGGKGRDILIGGAGSDRFDYNALSESKVSTSGRDIIRDFTKGQDKIDLSTIDGDGSGSSNAFHWIGTTQFSGEAGELRYWKENPSGTANDKTIISADVDGDGYSDFRIELTGLVSLKAADFYL